MGGFIYFVKQKSHQSRHNNLNIPNHTVHTEQEQTFRLLVQVALKEPIGGKYLFQRPESSLIGQVAACYIPTHQRTEWPSGVQCCKHTRRCGLQAGNTNYCNIAHHS